MFTCESVRVGRLSCPLRRGCRAAVAPELDGPDHDGPDLDVPDLDGPVLNGPDLDGPDLNGRR